MNWNHGLQGLLGGLSQGLGSFQQGRVQQEELANKEKLIKIQEAEEARQAQSAEFQRQKAAYEALAGDQDVDPTSISQYGNMPFIKSPTDPTKVRRPLSSAEATDAAQLKVAQFQLSDRERKQAALNAVRTDPTAASLSMPDMLRRLFLSGASDEYAPSYADISAEANAKAAPQITMNNADNAVQQGIAGMRNATDIRGQDITAGTQRYVADKAYDRGVDVAELRPDTPIKTEDYEMWKRFTALKDPRMAKIYNDIVSDPNQGLAVADTYLRDYYKKVR